MNKYEKELKIDVASEVVFKALTDPSQMHFWYDCNAQVALREGGHFTVADPTGDVDKKDVLGFLAEMIR